MQVNRTHHQLRLTRTVSAAQPTAASPPPSLLIFNSFLRVPKQVIDTQLTCPGAGCLPTSLSAVPALATQTCNLRGRSVLLAAVLLTGSGTVVDWGHSTRDGCSPARGFSISLPPVVPQLRPLMLSEPK